MDGKEFEITHDSLKIWSQPNKLSELEIAYLDLFAKNYSDDQIKKNLSISIFDIQILRNSIQQKTNEFDWLKIMQYCFEKDILNKLDYGIKLVESKAIKYASFIYDRLKSEKQTNKLFDLQKLLDEFYQCCIDKQWERMEIDETGKLSNIEKMYLNLKFEGINDIQILKELEINHRFVFIIKRNLLQKMDANSLYNAFRMAVASGLIKQQDSKCSKTRNFRSNLRHTHKICEFYLALKCHHEIKELIKVELISFYLARHYSTLFYQQFDKIS